MEETIVKQIHTSLLQIPTQTKTVVKQLICSSRNELGSRLTQTNNADDSASVDWENSHALQDWEFSCPPRMGNPTYVPFHLRFNTISQRHKKLTQPNYSDLLDDTEF